MSAPAFTFNASSLRSPSPASASKPAVDAIPAPIDRRTDDSQMLAFYGPMLKVRVGKGLFTESFFVHSTLFTSRSDFFKHAISQDSKENEEPVVLLREHMADTFCRYLNLVYAHQLVTKGDMQWLELCHLYVLAEKLQDVTSKNEIIDGMCVFFNTITCRPAAVKENIYHTLPAVATRELYDGTTYGSKARKLLVDLYADFGSETWLQRYRDPLPEDFYHELAIRLIEKRGPVFSDFHNSCPSHKYHDDRTSSSETTPSRTRKVEPVLADERCGAISSSDEEEA